MSDSRRLMRTWYPTDVDNDDPEYVGCFAAVPAPNPDSQIVHVDWSKRGEVEVTWLIP